MARALPLGGPVQATLQRRIWRWHFLAGLMVIPFAIVLAGSGALYLFKPQIEGWAEARVQAGLGEAPPGASSLPMDKLLAIAQNRHPEAPLAKLTLPRSPTDRSVEFDLRTALGPMTLWVDRYTGAILHSTRSDRRILAIAQDLHGSLLAGETGSWIVELMACWMIVLLLSGLYLWWPRGQAWWRIFLPQFSGLRQRREWWRRLHGAVGAWAAAFILLLLLSGLPWTSVWGAGFDWVQKRMGWDGPGQEWFVTLQSHKPTTPSDGLNLWSRGAGDEGEVQLESTIPTTTAEPLPLQAIVDRVLPQNLASPVEIRPPRGDNGVWTVRSMTQNRPLRQTVHYDRWSGEEIMRIRFPDYHPVQQTVSYGIALHEGALFGWLNQLLGLLTALAVVLLSISGCIVWWKRRPAGGLGLPPMPSDPRLGKGFRLLILGLAAFLPLMALSLLICLVCDWLWQCGLRLRTR